MNTALTVGILLFNEVEVMDFAGPFEVFSIAADKGQKLFDVRTVAVSTSPISARNGLKVIPDLTFADNPDFEILIVPGGYGAEEIEIRNPETIKWIREQYTKVSILASVCTGALLLAEAGILDNKAATTHWMDIDRLEQEYPKVKAIRNVRFVDEGNILTSGGISAGIDMSFHIMQKIVGKETADNTARRMEYRLIQEETL